MYKYALKYFQKINILGPAVGLEHNNSNRFKSTLGSTISLIAFIACAIIAFMFGQEVYQRKNPTLYSSQELLTHSEVPINALKIVLQLFDVDYQIYNILDYVSFQASTLIFDQINGIGIDYQSYHTLENNGTVTFDTNDTTVAANELFSTPSKLFRIHMFKCNSQIRKCADDIDTKFDSLSLGFLYTIPTYLDSTNYTNPVKTYVTNVAIPISDKLVKKIETNIKNDYIESDKGWLIEDKERFKALTVSDLVVKYNLAEKNDPNEKILLQFIAPKLVNKTTRNYMKVQTLFALIGGLFSGMILFTQVIFYHYLRYSYLVYFNSVDTNKDFNMKGSFNDNEKKDNNSMINLKSKYKSFETNQNQRVNYNNKTINDNNKIDNNNLVRVEDSSNISISALNVRSNLQQEKIAYVNKRSKDDTTKNKFNLEPSNGLLLLNNTEPKLSDSKLAKVPLNTLKNNYKNYHNDNYIEERINLDVNNVNDLNNYNIDNDIKNESKSKAIKGLKIDLTKISVTKSKLKEFNPNYFEFLYSLFLCRTKQLNLYLEFMNRVEKSLDIGNYKCVLEETGRYLLSE